MARLNINKAAAIDQPEACISPVSRMTKQSVAAQRNRTSNATDTSSETEYDTANESDDANSKTNSNDETEEEDDEDGEDSQASIRQNRSDDSHRLLSSLAALNLEPSAQEPGPVARRSPRKPAPRQRPFWVNDSIATIDADSTTGDEEQDDNSEDDSALSDFIVNDSASETELRRPKPRSVQRNNPPIQQQKPRRRLVQRSPAKKPPSVLEDSEEEVRVLTPRNKSVNDASPTKGRSQGLDGSSDKENETVGTKPMRVNFTDKLDDTVRLSPPRKSPSQSSSRAATPPLSPSRPRLQSPTRDRVHIPESPHRQSIDAFWDQGVVDQWNDVHSPKKTPAPAGRLLPLLLSPVKSKALQEFSDSDSEENGYESPSARSPKKTPAKSPSKGASGRDRAAIEAKKKFENEKHEIAASFLAELDSKITNGEIARLSASTGGVKLEWNKKLNSTAGRAKWKREKVRVYTPASSSPSPSGGPIEANNNTTTTISNTNHSSSSTSSSSSSLLIHHHASIELASKVIDSRPRLLNVLAHEFCHLTTFMISNIKDSPHGREFKSWAAKVSSTFADRGINVTTKHSYDIAYKYVWACTTCATEYKRHSKSIDTGKHVCSACKGALVQIRPAPRGGRMRVTGEEGDRMKDEEVGYSAFVKANFAGVKAEIAGEKGVESPAWGEVMGALARRWKVLKEKKEERSKIGSSVAEPRSESESSELVDGPDVAVVAEDLGSMTLGPAA